MRRFAIINCLLWFGVSIFGQETGVLKLHPQNPHYFIYQDKPLVIVGSGEHYGAVINLDFNYKKYLQTLSNDSLNTTRLFTGAYIEKPGDFGIEKNTLAPLQGKLILPWKRSNEPGFELGGNKFDLNEWDENYFTRLKDFMREAGANDVIVEVNLFSSHYAGGWNYSAFNPKNNINKTDSLASNMVNTLQNGNILKYQEQYVKKIVRELNSFGNFYFEIQNEPWADQTDTVLLRDEYQDIKDWRSGIQVVSELSNAWQKQVAVWIRETENDLLNKHLVSQNISNFYYPVINADPDISIFNFHYAKPEAVWQNYHLNKVIGFNETGFAGSDHTVYRRQAWRFMMAGGGLFNQLDYSFSADDELGTDTTFKAPGSGGKILREQLSILKQYFNKINFIDLKPDLSVVISATAGSTESLSNNSTEWIIYYEPSTSNGQKLSLKLVPGSYEAEWMDVVTGKIIEKNYIKTGEIKVPGGNHDKVLQITVSSTKN